jgi:hypothetical protein
MTGWKTKWGGGFVFAAGVLEVMAGSVPAPEWVPWLTCLSKVTMAAGVGLLGVGIAHKIEKAGNQ